jgi:hypothetical protein
LPQLFSFGITSDVILEISESLKSIISKEEKSLSAFFSGVSFVVGSVKYLHLLSKSISPFCPIGFSPFVKVEVPVLRYFTNALLNSVSRKR